MQAVVWLDWVAVFMASDEASAVTGTVVKFSLGSLDDSQGVLSKNESPFWSEICAWIGKDRVLNRAC